jgi:hypothetical protein
MDSSASEREQRAAFGHASQRRAAVGGCRCGCNLLIEAFLWKWLCLIHELTSSQHSHPSFRVMLAHAAMSIYPPKNTCTSLARLGPRAHIYIFNSFRPDTKMNDSRGRRGEAE